MTVITESGQLEFVFEDLQLCYETENILRVTDNNDDIVYFSVINNDVIPVFAYYDGWVYEYSSKFGWHLRTKRFLLEKFNVWYEEIFSKVNNFFKNGNKNIIDNDYLEAFKDLLNTVSFLQSKRSYLFDRVVRDYKINSKECINFVKEINVIGVRINKYLVVLKYLLLLSKGCRFC